MGYKGVLYRASVNSEVAYFITKIKFCSMRIFVYLFSFRKSKMDVSIITCDFYVFFYYIFQDYLINWYIIMLTRSVDTVVGFKGFKPHPSIYFYNKKIIWYVYYILTLKNVDDLFFLFVHFFVLFYY